jgi:uncharacterized protein YwgA
MLIKNILYAINLLSEKQLSFGKTFIQKVLYLSLPKESRDSYYIPYFYGPYSENVQMLLKSLEFSRYIEYDNNNHRYKLIKDIEGLKEDETDKRIITVLEFLSKNYITNTKSISNLAKTFMILDANNSLNNGHKTDNLVRLIKENADFVGWKELSTSDNDTLRKYLKQSKKLANSLPS